MTRVRRTETALLVAAASAVALTAVVALPVSTLVAGYPGLVGAAAGVGVLLVLFGVSAGLHAFASRLGWNAFLLITIGGLVLRLGVYFAGVQLLSGVERMSDLSLAFTAVAGIVLGHVFEMRVLAKGTGRAAPSARVADLEGAER